MSSPATEAQGIHVTLRANKNPFPGSRRYAGIWGDGHYAYLCSDKASGVLIFDVSNPDMPVLVRNYAPSNSYNMEEANISNGIGYFGSNAGGGIHIVDLSDPTNPRLITRITSAQGGYDNVHNLVVDGSYLYFPNYPISPAVQVWDVSNPGSPFLVTTIMTTDPLFIHDITVKNNRLYTSGWGGHTDIWDVTNIGNQPPVLLGTINSGVRSHSTWPTDDGNYLVSTRELLSAGDVSIYNIAQPSNPTLVATITAAPLGLNALTPHDPRIVGNLLYVSWYQAGLTVFDISDPTNPVLVGNYDTFPGPVVKNSFDGSWGVYPFLGQDRILVSDRTTGLYVLDATRVSSQPAVLALTFNPSSVIGSKPATGTAYLVGVSPSPGGTTLNLSSNNPALSASPVFIPGGAHSATFAQNTSSVVTTTIVNVTASAGTYSAVGKVTLRPPQPAAVTISPSSIRGGLNANGTVILNASAAADTTVSLALLSGASAIAAMPQTVIVPAGFTSASWTIQTKQLAASTQVKISATANGAGKNGTFTVAAISPSSLTFAPTSITGGNNTVGTVNFPAPLTQDTVVTLTIVSGSSAVASIPTSVTVTAGSSTATWNVATNPVAVTTIVKVQATSNNGSKTNSFTVH